MSDKVLFIGLGGIGQRHLRNLVSICPDIEVFALRKRREQVVLDDTLNPVNGESLEEKFGIKLVRSLDEGYEVGIRTVFICNPSSMHMETVMAAIKLGWNIFVEKPLSHNCDRLDELKLALKDYPHTSMIGFQNRFHPCVKTAKRLLNENAIGEICFVNAEIGENVTRWHPFEDYRRMYACRKELGGGVVLSQIHELDYLYYLFGMPQTVYAAGGKLSDLEIDVEDVADVLMEYQIGRKRVPVHVHEDYLQIPPKRKCKIQGTKGILTFDLINSEINLYDYEGNCIYHDLFKFKRNDMFIEELNNFLESAELGIQSAIPIEEGIHSLEIALAIKKSMREGLIVKL